MSNQIKIGDLVKIVGNKSKHGLELDELATVVKFACEGFKVIKQGSEHQETTFDNPDLWYVEYSDVEAI